MDNFEHLISGSVVSAVGLEVLTPLLLLLPLLLLAILAANLSSNWRS